MPAPPELVAGVDEAGRGPLAGPVVAAAVILDPGAPVPGLADSKTLSPARRAALFEDIRCRALAWSVAAVEAEEIDRVNILQATMRAMREAVLGLRPGARRVLVDGNRCPQLPVPALAVVGGDRREAAISAASIVAKESRDGIMRRLDAAHPGYGFAAHKGYPTRAHLEALRALGPSPVHRLSFGPVRALLESRPAPKPQP